MIFDKQAILSEEQAITATAVSTNVLDLGAMGFAAYNNIQLVQNDKGHKVPFLVMVNESFDLLTSLTINFQYATDEAFTSPVNVLSVSVPLAQLAQGYILPVERLPRGIKGRYFRLQYVVVGTNPTEGKITAAVVAEVDGAYVG